MVKIAPGNRVGGVGPGHPRASVAWAVLRMSDGRQETGVGKILELGRGAWVLQTDFGGYHWL